jgi:hypothetical protein
MGTYSYVLIKVTVWSDKSRYHFTLCRWRFLIEYIITKVALSFSK